MLEGFRSILTPWWASLVVPMVKNLPAMWETQVWTLDWEDPLEKGMATHSSILAWRIPWIEEPGGLQSVGLQRVAYNWESNTFTFALVTTGSEEWKNRVTKNLCCSIFTMYFEKKHETWCRSLIFFFFSLMLMPSLWNQSQPRRNVLYISRKCDQDTW